MKTLLLAFALILSFPHFAQQTETSIRYKDTFLRVFDANGNKFAKGKISDINDNSLVLKKGNNSVEIPMDKIHRIKTNHSAATNVLLGALGGAIIGGIIGAQDAEPDSWFYTTEAEAAAMGATAGGAIGAGLGGLSLLLRKGGVYHIQGSESAWEYFIKSMQE